MCIYMICYVYYLFIIYFIYIYAIHTPDALDLYLLRLADHRQGAAAAGHVQRRGAVGVVRVGRGALVHEPAHGHQAGRGAEGQQVAVQA